MGTTASAFSFSLWPSSYYTASTDPTVPTCASQCAVDSPDLGDSSQSVTRQANCNSSDSAVDVVDRKRKSACARAHAQSERLQLTPRLIQEQLSSLRSSAAASHHVTRNAHPPTKRRKRDELTELADFQVVELNRVPPAALLSQNSDHLPDAPAVHHLAYPLPFDLSQIRDRRTCLNHVDAKAVAEERRAFRFRNSLMGRMEHFMKQRRPVTRLAAD